MYGLRNLDLRESYEGVRREKRDKIQNKKQQRTNSAFLKKIVKFCPLLEQIAPLSTSFGTLRYHDGGGNGNPRPNRFFYEENKNSARGVHFFGVPVHYVVKCPNDLKTGMARR